MKTWEGEIIGWQSIGPGGNKRFAHGMKAGTGFFFIPGTGPLIVCEGVIDALSLASALPGVNVCSATSASMDKKLSVLKTLSVPPVFFFDNDEAGRKGTDKAAQMLEGSLARRRLELSTVGLCRKRR